MLFRSTWCRGMTKADSRKDRPCPTKKGQPFPRCRISDSFFHLPCFCLAAKTYNIKIDSVNTLQKKVFLDKYKMRRYILAKGGTWISRRSNQPVDVYYGYYKIGLDTCAGKKSQAIKLR